MKLAIRASKIEIDTLQASGTKWVSAILQTLELDENNVVSSVRARDKKLYRKVSDVALETVTFVDPVTGVETTISVAGIGEAIKAIMVKWMMEDHNATYDPTIDLVVLNDTSS